MSIVLSKTIDMSLIINLFTLAALNLSALQSGDLLFQVAGDSEFSKAISSSTEQDEDLSFAHVAILLITNESYNVIEASPNEGVRIISLEAFLSDSPFINGKPGVVVKRLNTDYCNDVMVNNAKSHLGEPYDWWYLPDNGKMYCSELIYESYLDSNGQHIFKASPMNFRSSDGTIPEFWIELFNRLEMNVPENVPGTNPNDMSKDDKLTEVFRFF